MASSARNTHHPRASERDLPPAMSQSAATMRAAPAGAARGARARRRPSRRRARVAPVAAGGGLFGAARDLDVASTVADAKALEPS